MTVLGYLIKENAGVSVASNAALEYATGEWVTGVDSDDYFYAIESYRDFWL